MDKLYIGFMSGTSLDGLDVSLIKTDGKNIVIPIENLHIPYEKNFQNKLKELLGFKIDVSLFDIEKELTNLHIAAAISLLSKANLKNSDIAALGFHGQTIYYNPDKAIIWQIGDPFMLAAQTGIKTIYDFRRRPMAYGGQGAPLIPIFHKAIMSDEKSAVAVVNIGGVANITYIGQNDELIAFDTGPGNALIDDACYKYSGQSYDKNGEIGRTGKIDINFVNKFLEKEYFSKSYPKSLDRNEFKSALDELLVANKNWADIISTLTYLTAASIAASFKHLPDIPRKIYLCGGGTHNFYLTELIDNLISTKYNCDIINISQKNNLNPDFIESEGFAYLAARYCNNLPSAFPSTTGVSKAVICGSAVEV